MLLGPIKGEQCAVLTNGHSFGGASRSIAILDDVASNSCWFYSDAEAGESGVPDHDLRSLGRNLLDGEFRLKDFRRIATRYDRLACNFMASVCIVAALVWWI